MTTIQGQKFSYTKDDKIYCAYATGCLNPGGNKFQVVIDYTTSTRDLIRDKMCITERGELDYIDFMSVYDQLLINQKYYNGSEDSKSKTNKNEAEYW